MSWSRRRFLRTGSAAAAAMGLSPVLRGCDPADEAPRSGRWGAPLTGDEEAALLPVDRRPEGVFEFYLFGGIAAWDTFYCVPELTDPARGGPYAGQQWWVYQQGEDSIPEHFERCGGGSRPMLEDFALDSAGNTVRLGPWLLPLRDRPDLLRRMRVLVMRHDQVPHQGGNPLSLGGHRLGNPRLAGTAAHLQRYWTERAGPRSVPYSHVLLPRHRDVEGNNADAAAATGLHPASARPLVLWLNEHSEVRDQLERRVLRGREQAYDRLVNAYRAQYEDRLRFGPTEDRRLVRAPALEDYRFSRQSLAGAPELLDLLPSAAFAPRRGDICGVGSEQDLTTTGLDLALSLLLDERSPARYVNSVDGAFLPTTGGASYDTHSNHVLESSRNVTHAFRELARRINEPGENDPGKLDLDRHAVLITTEFGRTPYREGDTGLDHWPGGYVQVVLGGWVDEDRSGVLGAIGADGYATDYVTPAEFRAAVLMSLGIWPFSPESFAVGDVRQGETELESALWLREHLLGYRS